MHEKSTLEDNEIDLRELFAVLWSHKLLITLFTGLFIFTAGYYSLTVEKKFTASATFQIEQNSGGSGANLSRDLGALAAIVGLSSQNKSTTIEALIERAARREFILDMREKYSLDLDPYFNT